MPPAEAPGRNASFYGCFAGARMTLPGVGRAMPAWSVASDANSAARWVWKPRVYDVVSEPGRGQGRQGGHVQWTRTPPKPTKTCEQDLSAAPQLPPQSPPF